MLIKKITQLIIVLICTVIIADLLIIIAYSIPTDRMFSHAKASAELFGSSYIEEWTPDIPSATLSYSTDAIMINSAIYQDNKSVVYNAMMNPRYEDGSGNVTNSLLKVLASDKLQDINPKKTAVAPEDSFRDDSNTTHEIETMYYPRYWHGYLTILKPLLMVLDVSEIKMLTMTIQVFLAFLTVFLIEKKIDKGVAFGFLTALIVLNPVTVALTFQENTIYMLSLVSMVLVLMFNDRIKRKDSYALYFMVWGSLTCFFDFLTYPLVTLGFPLCLAILLNHNKYKESIIIMIKYSIAWAIGYVGLWFGKFISCTLLTDFDLLSYSMKSIVFRMGIINLGNSQFEISAIEAIKRNLSPVYNWISLFIILTIVAICIVSYKLGFRKCLVREKTYSLLLLSTYPFFWYVGTKNHSYIHYYMTYRELAITWFCLTSIVLYKWEKT